MRKTSPQISDAEWSVMRVVWDHGPLTANSVVDSLQGQKQWKPKTVHTLLRRLVEKGVAGVDKSTREHFFYPILSADECEHDASRSFIDNVFGGKLAPMLATFVKREDLSNEEIEELKKILEGKNES